MMMGMLIIGGLIILTAIGVAPNIISVIKQKNPEVNDDSKIVEIEKRIQLLEEQSVAQNSKINELETENKFLTRLIENRNTEKS